MNTQHQYRFYLLAFHYDRGSLDSDGKYAALRNLVDELDREAARVAQGIYILSFHRHLKLIEEIPKSLQQIGLHFVRIPFPEKDMKISDYVGFWHFADREFLNKMSSFSKDYFEL